MRLHPLHLLHYPTARIQSRDAHRTTVRIEGLVCDDVCAARSQRALSQLDGVHHVAVDFESGTAAIEGASHTEADYQRALDSVVAMKPLRRALARLRPSAAPPGREADKR